MNAGAAGGADAEHDPRGQNKILKGLLNAEEEKESGNANFNKLNLARMPQRAAGNNDSKNNGNNMLLQLLNEKSDDDDNMDGRPNQRNHSELLRQLQKDETTKDHTNTNPIGNDELIQMLRFQGNDFTNRKRPNNDSDDSPSAKRAEDKPSKLREKNKMLASLLSNPSKAPTTFTTPMVKTIPDIPQSRIPNPEQQTPQTILNNQKAPQQMVNMHQQLQQHQVRASPQVRKPSDLYLNQQMPTQPELNKNHPVSFATFDAFIFPKHRNSFFLSIVICQMMQPPATRAPDFQFDTGSYATSTAATPSQPQSGCDPELSEILNTVIDIVPEYQGNSLLGTMMSEPSANVATPIQPQNHQDINEKMAINAITKSLMQFENTTGFNNSPPAYSMHNVNTQAGTQVIDDLHRLAEYSRFIHFMLQFAEFSTSTCVYSTPDSYESDECERQRN